MYGYLSVQDKTGSTLPLLAFLPSMVHPGIPSPPPKRQQIAALCHYGEKCTKSVQHQGNLPTPGQEVVLNGCATFAPLKGSSFPLWEKRV